MSKQEIICPICESKNIKFEKKYRNNHSCFSNLNRMICLNCRLQFAHPMPLPINLNIYNSSYHESAHGGSNRDFKQKAFFIGLAKTRLAFIREKISLEKYYPYNILEIGPGPGIFVKVWMENFPRSNYYVIESDRSCHDELNKIGVKIIQSTDGKIKVHYDLIIISHVLEHVMNPKEFLNPFIKKLKKGGHLFIEVPCMDWKYKDIDEPHLLFFDKLAMEVLLNKIKLTKIIVAYYGIPHRILLNPLIKFMKRIRGFLWRKGITFYHREKYKIYNLVKDEVQTQALLNFDAHKEQIEPAWWLRVLSKK